MPHLRVPLKLQLTWSDSLFTTHNLPNACFKFPISRIFQNMCFPVLCALSSPGSSTMALYLHGGGVDNVLTNKYTCACMQAHSCIPHIPSINSTHDHIFLLLTQIMVLLSFPEGTILTGTSNNLSITLFFPSLYPFFCFQSMSWIYCMQHFLHLCPLPRVCCGWDYCD